MSAPEGDQGPCKVRVLVAGGGWAGCAAAVELAREGCTGHAGRERRARLGRARTRRRSARQAQVDNGQHILLGAYDATLRLLADWSASTRKQALLRLPVQMRYPDRQRRHGFRRAALAGAACTCSARCCARRDWRRADKLALARFNSAAQMDGLGALPGLHAWTNCWRASTRPRASIACCGIRCASPRSILRRARASAKVFLAVLRDSLGARRRAASDMLLPRLDMGALFPQAAARLSSRQHRGVVRTGVQGSNSPRPHRRRVAAVEYGRPIDATVRCGGAGHARPPQTAALLDAAPGLSPGRPCCIAGFELMSRLPPATCNTMRPRCVSICRFYALLDDPARRALGPVCLRPRPARRGPAGAAGGRGQRRRCRRRTRTSTPWRRSIAAQLAQDLQRFPRWPRRSGARVITEKRATFSCTPGLDRPGQRDRTLPGLVLAGDYTASDYPATLETAVRSGVVSAATIIRAYGALPREKRSLSHGNWHGQGPTFRKVAASKQVPLRISNNMNNIQLGLRTLGLIALGASSALPCWCNPELIGGSKTPSTALAIGIDSRSSVTTESRGQAAHGQTGIPRRAQARHDGAGAGNAGQDPGLVRAALSSTAWPPAAAKRASPRNSTIRARWR